MILPTSFFFGALAAIAAVDISRKIVPAKIVTGIIAGAIFVGAGGLVAPSHKIATMIALVIINGFYSLSQAKTLLLAPGERVDWVSVSRVFGGAFAPLGLWPLLAE